MTQMEVPRRMTQMEVPRRMVQMEVPRRMVQMEAARRHKIPSFHAQTQDSVIPRAVAESTNPVHSCMKGMDSATALRFAQNDADGGSS